MGERNLGIKEPSVSHEDIEKSVCFVSYMENTHIIPEHVPSSRM